MLTFKNVEVYTDFFTFFAWMDDKVIQAPEISSQ